MANILFLDLENTLVEPINNGFLNFTLINQDKIDRFFDLDLSFDEIYIFSFAIKNAFDLNAFNLKMRQRINDTYGITITQVITIEMLMKLFEKLDLENPIETEYDLTNKTGKLKAFQLFADIYLLRKWGLHGERPEDLLILIDDDVKDTFIENQGSKIITLNVESEFDIEQLD